MALEPADSQDPGHSIKEIKAIEGRVDHRCLNEVEGVENSASENLARWLWNALLPVLPARSKIVVRETSTSVCIYMGESQNQGISEQVEVLNGHGRVPSGRRAARRNARSNPRVDFSIRSNGIVSERRM